MEYAKNAGRNKKLIKIKKMMFKSIKLKMLKVNKIKICMLKIINHITKTFQNAFNAILNLFIIKFRMHVQIKIA